MKIDITFDFRTDSGGKDPDTASLTLKRYHKFLWSKFLPSGEPFVLKDSNKGTYLSVNVKDEVINLTSDSIANSYGGRKNPPEVIKEFPVNIIQSFRDLNSTIGAFILFPGNQILGKRTINQERGINNLIEDRFDLTLECIRRAYRGEDSPIYETLMRYEFFFEMFQDFQKYVDFFLLNDLVTSDYSQVIYFNREIEPFKDSPISFSIDSYLEYRENSMKFTSARNSRILTWVEELSPTQNDN